ncbi:MAG: hypothetical protein IJX25_00215 [Clostridia bacterium]|nr:hypothetical protein [Clostridia bacterium]
MPRGNVNNLKRPSSEEARKNGSKGGIKSGEVRREKRLIQDALQKALSGVFDVDDHHRQVGGYDALAISMIKEALGGNVQAFKEIRDTIGEKPKDTVSVESSELTGIKINFVNKSGTRKGKEKDPKIVGDYTPSTNTEE